mmetsp:Transcript_54617/g.98003  ORF Transcript_54617/g.98003 Transcript_54617/m.98003 type:complete len:845 (-) Transcript_54617:13-2547(-)
MAPSYSLSCAVELPSQLSSSTPLPSRSPRRVYPGPSNPGYEPLGESHLAQHTNLRFSYGHRDRGTPRPASSLRLPIAVAAEESSANGLAGGTASVPRSPVESRTERSYYSAWHCRSLGLHAYHPATGLQSWGKGDMPDEDTSARKVRMKTAYDEDPDEVYEMSQVIHSRQATTDLIAACAAVQKCRRTSRRFVACPLPNRSGSKSRSEMGSANGSRSGSKSRGLSKQRVGSSKRYVRGRRRDTLEIRTEEVEKAAKAEADMERVRMASECFLNAQLEEEREEKCRYYALVFSEELQRWKALSQETADRREKRRKDLEEKERRWRELTAPALNSVARAKARALEQELKEKRVLASKMANVVSDLNSYLDDGYSDDEDIDVKDEMSDGLGLDISFSPRSLTPAISPQRSNLKGQRPGSSATATPPPRSASASGMSNQSGRISPNRSASRAAEDDRRSVTPLAAVAEQGASSPSTAGQPKSPAQQAGAHGKRGTLRNKRFVSVPLEQAALKVRVVLLGELRRQMVETEFRKQTSSSASAGQDEDETTAERKPRIAFEGEADPSGAKEPEHVRDRYLELCKMCQCKPNSLALAKLNEIEKFSLNKVYDFSNALLGDRGCICLLQALAEDPHCTTLCLKGCGLKGASVIAIAAFLELHPQLRHMDLSNNSFSYDAGEQILEALVRRSRGQSRDEEYGRTTPSRQLPDLASESARDNLPQLHEVTVNLGGTWFAWDRAGQLTASGPPCGNLWAGHAVNSQRRFAPSGYERLRSQLDDTQHIQYEDSLDKMGRPEASDEFEADAAKNRLLMPGGALSERWTKRNTAMPGSIRPSLRSCVHMRTMNSKIFGV